jgi:hypothetical protein
MENILVRLNVEKVAIASNRVIKFSHFASLFARGSARTLKRGGERITRKERELCPGMARARKISNQPHASRRPAARPRRPLLVFPFSVTALDPARANQISVRIPAHGGKVTHIKLL